MHASFVSFEGKKLDRTTSHYLLDSIVCPRPIFFISTLGKNNVNNLAPYSMSTIASPKPPMVCFSANLHYKDKSEKDTLINVRETGEFVVNMVTAEMLTEVLVCARAFSPNESELEQTSLNTVESIKVSPPRILESPASMECKVHSIIELGEGSLVLGKVLMFHVQENIYQSKEIPVDPFKLSIIGRMGGNYFLRSNDIFETSKWRLFE
jgi:flavin reductase (DIM6/NTAB) family NADH-FMN oxidoreductase RutF